MIIIKWKSFTATFTGKEWYCEDSFFQDLLNDATNDAEFGVDSPFRVGPQGTVGADAIALESILHLGDIKVIKNEPPEVPEDIDGVVY